MGRGEGVTGGYSPKRMEITVNEGNWCQLRNQRICIKAEIMGQEGRQSMYGCPRSDKHTETYHRYQ